MKKRVLLGALIAFSPSMIFAADSVVVIPFKSNTTSSSGLIFDITADGTTYTSQSKGWTLAGYDAHNNATFFTDTGYLFVIHNSVEYRLLKQLTIMYLGASCTGPAIVGWNNGGFINGEVFRNGTDLFYTKPTDTNLGQIGYLSYRADGAASCTNSSGTSWEQTYYAYPNDENITGVSFSNPKSIVLTYKREK